MIDLKEIFFSYRNNRERGCRVEAVGFKEEREDGAKEVGRAGRIREEIDGVDESH